MPTRQGMVTNEDADPRLSGVKMVRTPHRNEGAERNPFKAINTFIPVLNGFGVCAVCHHSCDDILKNDKYDIND